MTVLRSTLDPKTDTYIDAASAAISRLDEIDAELAKALGGGGPKYVERHHARGKLTARERIELLVDLKMGSSQAAIRTTDLSHAYVEENSAYSS